jgi:ubiquitin-protein ligase
MTDADPGATIPEQQWSGSAWYERNSTRLAREEQVMRDKFPQFSLNKVDGQLYWRGTLRSNSYNRYDVGIYYPSSYPYEAPEPYILDPDVTEYGPPHIYRDGMLCVFYRSDGTWEQNSTMATMVGLVGAWINAFEHWRETGEWPGPEAD